MTQSELNSIPLYSRVRAYWGTQALDGYLIKVSGANAVLYIPDEYRLIYDYPASGITLVEAYQPNYIQYPTYDLETLPMFSTIVVSYQGVQRTAIVIDKSLALGQVYVFYTDSSAEWVRMNYVSFVSAPGPGIQPVIPPEQYTPGVQPPGEVLPAPPNLAPPIVVTPFVPEIQDKTPLVESKTNVIVIALLAIVAISLIK